MRLIYEQMRATSDCGRNLPKNLSKIRQNLQVQIEFPYHLSRAAAEPNGPILEP